MNTIHLRDTELHTFGNLPKIGTKAPNFFATKADLSTVELNDYIGRPVLINVFLSIDTGVCFSSAKEFDKAKTEKKLDFDILCISMDTPFALRRVSCAENFDNVTFLSDFRNREFGDLYGLTIVDSAMAGFLTRAVILLDKNHEVVYLELVDDIANPPNYKAALEHL